MKVLVACEESRRVCSAFRERGHEAYSCDIQEPSGGHPEWHILGDCIPLLGGGCEFLTMDGARHKILGKWDLIIAHPPCTYLSNAGACRLYTSKGVLNEERVKQGICGRDLFMRIWWADAPRVAIENPIPSSVFMLPKYTEIIQPYEHGEPYQKKTCLWLKGLPPLVPTNIVEGRTPWVSGGSKDGKGQPRKRTGIKNVAKDRSKTFPGIAKAMAEQWG